MKITLVYVCLTLLLMGCRQELPKPETLKVAAAERELIDAREMIVRHAVQGNNIYVECIVPTISFSHADQGANKGKIHLYIDEVLHGQYDTAAFVVKNISKGNHLIRINIVNENNQPLGMSKRFSVTIK